MTTAIEALRCASCNGELPSGARFCPSCGAGAGAAAEEPVSITAVPPRLFGVVPPLATLALGLLALAAAVLGPPAGHWVLGPILLALSLAALALYAEGARRRPYGLVERATATGLTRLREQLGLVGGAAGAWSQASRELLRLRGDLRRIRAERARAQYELGAAAYAEDAERCTALRERLRELDERASGSLARIEATLAGAHRRVARERLAVQRTAIIPPEKRR